MSEASLESEFQQKLTEIRPYWPEMIGQHLELRLESTHRNVPLTLLTTFN